jgi:O-antigen ligase
MRKVINNIVLLAILTLPLSQVAVRVGAVPIYVPEAFILSALVCYIVGVSRHRVRLVSLPHAVIVGACMFLIGAVLSVLHAGTGAEELGALKSWVIFPLVLGFLITQAFSEGADRMKLVIVWYAGMVAVAAVSLSSLPIVRITYDGRLASYFASPNHLALFLEPGLLFGVYLFRDAFRRRAHFLNAIAAFGSVLIAAALIRTMSAGSFIAVGAGIVFYLAYALRLSVGIRRVIIGLIIICILALTIPVVANWRTLGSGETRSSMASRVMIWNASFLLLRHNPVLGIGMRTFEREYLAVQPVFPPYLEWAVPHPHSLVLAAWLATGISGLAGLAVLIVTMARSLWHTMKSGEGAMLATLFLAYLVTLVVHGFVDVPLFKTDLALMFFSLAGIASTLGTNSPVPVYDKTAPAVGSGR